MAMAAGDGAEGLAEVVDLERYPIHETGMVGQPRRTLDIYGRLTDAHRAQPTARADGLMD